MLYTPEDIAIINTFKNLGEAHMEQKQITRLEKLLERGIQAMIKEAGLEQIIKDYSLSGYLLSFKSDRFDMWITRWTDKDYEHYKFKNTPPTAENNKHLFDITMLATKFMVTVDRYYFVKEKRWMRNGVIPKSLIKPISPAEYIKGKLSVAFQPMLNDLAAEMRTVETIYWGSIISSKRKVNHVNWNQLEEVYYDDAKIQENVKQIVENVVSGFVYRLVDKLGGFEPKSKIIETNHSISDNKNFIFNATFENGDSFCVQGKVVWNMSPLGTPFSQYPITFHNLILGGERVDNSEYNFKKFFKEA